MITSQDPEKAYDKIQYLFMIKTLSILGVERNFHNLIKGTYEKCAANIILNSERLNFSPLRLRIR